MQKASLQKLATAGCEPAKFMLDFSKYKTLLNNFITKMVVHLEKDLPVRFKLYGYRVPTARLAAGSYKVSKKKDGVYDWFAPMNLQAVAKPKHVMRELNYDLKTKQIQFLPDDQTGEYYVEAGTSDLNARCWIGGHEGRIIVETDYSQLELLIPINLSKEPVWMEAKRQGQDLHKVTAAMIWNKPYADVTYDERQIAKRCFSINTFIATRDGWVRSKDLNGRAILDLKLKDQGYKAVIEKRQGFRVTLSNGQQIECVDDHNWVCFNRHKLVKVPASKLKIGDYLGVRQDSVFATDYLRFEIGDGYKSHAFHGEVVLDEALGYLLGLYLGDGYLTLYKTRHHPDGVLNQMCLVVSREHNEVYVRETLNRYHGLDEQAQLKHDFWDEDCDYVGHNPLFNDKEYSVLYFSSKSFMEWVYQHCGRTKSKHVPDIIFQSPLSVIKSFLAGLFDADGSGWESANGQKLFKIALTNFRLLHGIADLAAYIGCHTRFERGTAKLKARYRKDPSKGDYVTACGSLVFVKTVPDVPLRLPVKRAIWNSKLNACRYGFAVHLDDLDQYRPVGRKGTGLSRRASQLCNYIRKGQQTCTPQWFMREVGWVHKDYDPVTVKEIEPIELDAWVMETDTHWFIGAGQTSPNCNFGLMYSLYEPGNYDGMIYTMISRIGLDPATAAMIAPRYVSALPTLYQWKLSLYAEAIRTGMITNIYGFEYKIAPYLKSGQPKIVKYGKKLAVSVVGQGMGGWFGRLALIKAAKTLYYPGAPWKGRLDSKGEPAVQYVNMVHDSLVFDVSAEVLDEWIPVQVGIMESVTPKGWEIPLEADPSIGPNYGELFGVVRRDDGVYIPKSEPDKRKSKSTSPIVSEPEIDFEDEDEETDEFGDLL